MLSAKPSNSPVTHSSSTGQPKSVPRSGNRSEAHLRDLYEVPERRRPLHVSILTHDPAWTREGAGRAGALGSRLEGGRQDQLCPTKYGHGVRRVLLDGRARGGTECPPRECSTWSPRQGLYVVRAPAPPERPDEALLFLGDNEDGVPIEVVGVNSPTGGCG